MQRRVGTDPNPCSRGTFLGARAEVTTGHRSCLSLSGSANLCHLPAQEQPFPAAWAPLAGGTPQAPQAPPAGLQRAPCGCLFDPRVFRIQWTTTDLPPPATATLGQGAASLPGAALWGPGGCGAPLAWAAPGTPQGQPQYLAPYKNKRSGVAPAPLELPVSIPSYEDIEGLLAKINTSCTATPPGAPPGSDIPASPCADPHNQALWEPVGELVASEEVALQEALVLFDCSLDGVGVSQDAPSSSPMPEDTGGTGTATPDRDFSSLSLPEELLTPDYCIPELSDIMLSLKISNVIGMEPQELWEDAGMDLPPSPPAVADKPRKRQAQSSFPMPPSKRRALTANMGL
ncbi:proline-rich protein 22-like [Aquila chrysaetos chrysaetos]|uniref:proline-rich protein 22-like n=1 Tax=Aquila chrysaetos chrysaetos TaxID=223781 RepID=UPI001B7D47F0|nr:proline-rich protein 22-like [Aquila chrysaetos chrysaetos]